MQMIDTLRAADPCRHAEYDAASPHARRMLDEIVATPRVVPPGPRPRRGRVLAVGGVLALAAAAVVLAVSLSPSTHHENVALGPSGYRVSTSSDGSVKVLVRWGEMKNPAALQRALDRAGARTKIWVTDARTFRPWCTGSPAPYQHPGRPLEGTVDYHAPDGVDGIVVHPSKFPSGTTLLLTWEKPHRPTAAESSPYPGMHPRLVGGWSTYWAQGPVPSCY